MRTISIPDEVAEILGDEPELSRKVLEAIVLELFRSQKISAGKAAEILGLSYRSFLELLASKEIPFVVTPPREQDEINAIFASQEGKG